MEGMIKTLEPNIHRRWRANNFLDTIIVGHDVDILLIIGPGLVRISSSTWTTDVFAIAAIWIPDLNKASISGCGAGNYFVGLNSGDIINATCYLTCSDGITLFRVKLREFRDALREFEDNLLIVDEGNTNARE